MEFSSNGKGNLAVTLGAVGTGLSILNGGLGNILGGLGTGNLSRSCECVATKTDLEYIKELNKKDGEISLLKANNDANNAIMVAFNNAHSEIISLRNEFSAARREQDAWNSAQSVLNAQMSSAIATNLNSIGNLGTQLGAVVKTVIPSTNVWTASTTTATA